MATRAASWDQDVAPEASPSTPSLRASLCIQPTGGFFLGGGRREADNFLMGFPADRWLRGTGPAHEARRQPRPHKPGPHKPTATGVSQEGARGAETDGKQSPTLAPPCSVPPPCEKWISMPGVTPRPCSCLRLLLPPITRPTAAALPFCHARRKDGDVPKGDGAK